MLNTKLAHQESKDQLILQTKLENKYVHMMNEQFHSTIMRLQRINGKSETETILEGIELKNLKKISEMIPLTTCTQPIHARDHNFR